MGKRGDGEGGGGKYAKTMLASASPPTYPPFLGRGRKEGQTLCQTSFSRYQRVLYNFNSGPFPDPENFEKRLFETRPCLTLPSYIANSNYLGRHPLNSDGPKMKQKKSFEMRPRDTSGVNFRGSISLSLSLDPEEEGEEKQREPI